MTSSFVTGPGATTLPMVIFSKVRLGVSPDINALATIIIAIVGAGVVIASCHDAAGEAAPARRADGDRGEPVGKAARRSQQWRKSR